MHGVAWRKTLYTSNTTLLPDLCCLLFLESIAQELTIPAGIYPLQNHPPGLALPACFLNPALAALVCMPCLASGTTDMYLNSNTSRNGSSANLQTLDRQVLRHSPQTCVLTFF